MYQFKLVGQIAVFNVGECKLIGLEASSLSLLHKFKCSTWPPFDLSITLLFAWSYGLMVKLLVLFCFHTMLWQAFEVGGRNDNCYRLHQEVHRKKRSGRRMPKALAVNLWRNVAFMAGLSRRLRILCSRVFQFICQSCSESLLPAQNLSSFLSLFWEARSRRVSVLTATGSEKQARSAVISTFFFFDQMMT